LAGTYFLTRDYATAIRLIEELPGDSAAFSDVSKDQLLGVYLHWAGHDQRARPLLERARAREIALLADKTLSPRQVILNPIHLAEIELMLGNQDAAVQIAERGAQSEALAGNPIDSANYRGSLAAIYANVSRKDEAIALISELLKLSPGCSDVAPYTLRLDPTWDPLRDDPRFQALLEKYPAEVRFR